MRDFGEGDSRGASELAGRNWLVSRLLRARDWVRSSPFIVSPRIASRRFAEAAAIAKRSGISRVKGDKYAVFFVVEAWQANGILFQPHDIDTSQIYLRVMPQFNAGQVGLLDRDDLLRELRQLERRRGSGGRDRVEHPRDRHDDAAAAACGALVQALGGPSPEEQRRLSIRMLEAGRYGGLVDIREW